jgi:hypothetical protein
VAGFVALFAWRAFRDVRALALAVAVVLVILLSSRAKPYYFGPAFPLLFAAGAVWLDTWLGPRRTWRWGFTTAFLATALVLAPMGLPLLPVRHFIAYAERLGAAPSSAERHALAELPQHFADMFGWESMAATVSGVYRSLAPAEQAGARVYAQNYGEAGAMEYFAVRYPLPPVISGHNTYFLWGPGPPTDGPVIIVGGRVENHARAFDDVQEVARTSCDYCMPYERNLPVFVGRGLRQPLNEIWPGVKHYD